MSTFDKNAVEESIRLKESSGGSVTIVTVGRSDAKKTVKEALAMGGDRGYLVVVAEPDPHDSLTTAYLLARAIERAGPFDLVLCAEGSSDIYAGQVGPMLSEWLALPFLGYVRKVEINGRVIRCEQTLEERCESWKQSSPPSSRSSARSTSRATRPSFRSCRPRRSRSRRSGQSC